MIGMCIGARLYASLCDRQADQVARMTTALILNVVYGHQVKSSDDEVFQMAENIVEVLREGSLPSLLDISTICKFIV